MIVGMSVVAVCQNVNVNIDNSSNYSDGYKYINGVCSCEDIGGVEFGWHNVPCIVDDVNSECSAAILHNRNSFRVSVLYEIVTVTESGNYMNSGCIVLDTNEERSITSWANENGFYRFELNGLIVRKMAQ